MVSLLNESGEDVSLRSFTQDDIDDVLVYASSDAVTEHTAWQAQDRTGVAAFLAQTGDTPTSLHRAIVWRRTDEVIGGIHIWHTDSPRVAEMGYVVNPAFAGLGVATTAATWCLRCAFDDWNMTEVLGRCRPENGASARVLEKLGMSLRTTIANDVTIRGVSRSSLLFGITRSDWALAQGLPAGLD